MLAYELYRPRNLVFLIHLLANILWQFLTLTPTIERIFRVVDLSTIMPLLFSGLNDVAAAELRPHIRRVGLTVFAVASLATLFAPRYNVATQAFGLAAFAYIVRPVLAQLDSACQQMGWHGLLIFFAYAASFLVHVVGDKRSIVGLMNLTDKVRQQHAGTRLGMLLDFANLYDVGHWLCVACYFVVAPCRS